MVKLRPASQATPPTATQARTVQITKLKKGFVFNASDHRP
jgi:hypothetical protein